MRIIKIGEEVTFHSEYGNEISNGIVRDIWRVDSNTFLELELLNPYKQHNKGQLLRISSNLVFDKIPLS